jgi:hypothetical protein
VTVAGARSGPASRALPALGQTLGPARRLVGWAGWPWLLLAVILVTRVARFATYDPWADGPLDLYRWAAVLWMGVAGATALLLRLQLGPALWVPLLTAAAVLLPGDAVHYARISHPLSRTREYALVDAFQDVPSGAQPAPARWLPELQEGASAAVVEGQLKITAPPSRSAFVGLRVSRELDPNLNLFWLPRGAFATPEGEVLEWAGRVQLRGQVAVVLETRTLRIEATTFGLRITYLLLDGRLDGADLEAPEVGRGEVLRYRLERTAAHPLQRLFLGDREVWARPKPPGAWEFVRFGATRTGEEHGATLTVDDVRYQALFGEDGESPPSRCPGGALFCGG